MDYPADYPEPGLGYPPQPPPAYPIGAPWSGPPPSAAPGSFPAPHDPYDPYHQYGSGTPTGTNGKAIGSMICGALSLVLCMCFAPSLAAIILGILGLSETRRTGQAGQGLAIGGLVLGCVTMIGGLVLLALGAIGSWAEGIPSAAG